MKTCKIENCNNKRWANGFCKYHYTPKMPLQAIRSSRMNDNEKQVGDISQMRKFFLELWNKRRHYCENCGEWLGNIPLSYHFDHTLEKSKYPELKYEEDNIEILCLKCHDEKTRGVISEKIKERIEQLKEKFHIFA